MPLCRHLRHRRLRELSDLVASYRAPPAGSGDGGEMSRIRTRISERFSALLAAEIVPRGWRSADRHTRSIPTGFERFERHFQRRRVIVCDVADDTFFRPWQQRIDAQLDVAHHSRQTVNTQPHRFAREAFT